MCLLISPQKSIINAFLNGQLVLQAMLACTPNGVKNESKAFFLKSVIRKGSASALRKGIIPLTFSSLFLFSVKNKEISKKRSKLLRAFYVTSFSVFGATVW